MNKSQLNELIIALNTIKAEYELVVADAEETEARLAEVEALNASQADDLAYVKGRYDKESGTKLFASINGTLGYKDDDFTYGVGATLGIRWGKGFMTTVGGSYDLGKLSEKPDFTDLKKNNCHMTVGLGWEF